MIMRVAPIFALSAALLLAACGSSDDNDMPDTSSGSTAISGGGGRTLGVNSYLLAIDAVAALLNAPKGKKT